MALTWVPRWVLAGVGAWDGRRTGNMAITTLIVAGGVLEGLESPLPDWPRAPTEVIRGPMRVHTFVSPDCSLRMMERLIAGVSESIDLYIYNVGSEEMLQLLRDALKRNVMVRVIRGLPRPQSRS
jgi:hypothetical protein